MKHELHAASSWLYNGLETSDACNLPTRDQGVNVICSFVCVDWLQISKSLQAKREYTLRPFYHLYLTEIKNHQEENYSPTNLKIKNTRREHTVDRSPFQRSYPD